MPNTYTNKVQVTRGGQTETLIDLTADTAIASDVAQGKYFHLASGERVVGTATGGGGGGAVYQDQDGYIVLSDQGGGGGGGGGGASNVVYGSFTTNASEGAQTVNVPYSGSGYPVMITVFPPNGAMAIDAQGNNYAISSSYLLKCASTTAPTYSGNDYANRYVAWVRYANGGTWTASSNPNGAFIATGAEASASATGTLRPVSDTTLSIYVKGTSYGFLPETEYKYVVVYSE